MSQVSPQLTVLTGEQINHIHRASLEILGSTGLKVHSKQALNIFSKSDGVTIHDDTVCFAPTLVEACINSSPDSVNIYNRKREMQFQLSSNSRQEAIFGIGVTNTHYQQVNTGEIQVFEREHIAQAARLAHSLENFDLLSTPGVLAGSSLKDAEVLAALEMLANTDKPLVLLINNTLQFDKTLDLFENLLGDLSKKPFLLPYVNPVTPLVLNTETADKMIRTIERDLPIIYSCYGMSGATAPITASGTLVLHNAELLAGLVFSQLIRPGSPIIMGCLPAVFEMRHMTSAYTPQTILINQACAEMMRHYKIPHAGTSGSGAGWGPDLPASGLLWMNHLTSAIGAAGLVPFVGGNFDSLVFSPENVVYSNEIIRLARLFTRGFELSDAAIGLENISEVGPGGNFLQSEQTLTLFREVNEQHNQIWPGVSLEEWQKMGSPQASKLLQSLTLEKLEKSSPPADHDDLIAKGEAWLQKHT